MRTGCGFSEWEEAGDLLGQGSGGAAKVSALNLAKKLEGVFEGSTELAKYGSYNNPMHSKMMHSH